MIDKIKYYDYITGKTETTTKKQWEKYGKSAERMAEEREKDRQRKRTKTTIPKIKTVAPIKNKPDKVTYKDPITGKQTTTTKKRLERYKDINKIARANVIDRLRRQLSSDSPQVREQAETAIENIKKTNKTSQIKKEWTLFEKIKKNFEKWKKQKEKRRRTKTIDTEPEANKNRDAGENEKQKESYTNTNPKDKYGSPTNKWQQYLYDLLTYAYNNNLPIYADFDFTSDKINELIEYVESAKNNTINTYIDNAQTPDFDISDYMEE